MLVVLLAVAVVVLGIWSLLPKTGTLLVRVSGPKDEAIEQVQVFLDGEEVCSKATCRLEDVRVGSHFLSVVAEGYKKTADTTITVEGNQDNVFPITLSRVSKGTGIRVPALGTGLRLTVNGHDEGPLPIELKKMEPGEYQISITGNERYESHEEQVLVEADKIVAVAPTLKVVKGLAHIKAGEGAEGAKVLLVSGSERRPLPNLPIKIDIKPEKPYTLVAVKPGYQTYSKPISFDDGKAEKTYEIVMRTDAQAAAEEDAATQARARKGTRSYRRSRKAASAGAATGGRGRLNISSNPPSMAILDGRPLGKTPRTGIVVAPGPHSVMFVHPTHGRKVQRVNVKAGRTASVGVRFP